MWDPKRGKSHLLGTDIPPQLPRVRLNIPYQLNDAEGARNGISHHTPVVFLYGLHLVFIKSRLYTQPMCNLLNFEHTSFLTMPDSQCFERSLGVEMSFSIFVALTSRLGPGKECAFN